MFTFSVCACGKWICTSNKCSQGYTDIFKNNVSSDEDEDDDDSFEYDDDEDEDDITDEEDPEDDPDVQDIKWFY